jgi:Tol biopolymer transport system component
VGLVLYEMATGKRLTSPEQANAVIPSGFPGRFAHVLERCLADDPDNRWHSARDLRLELDWAAKPDSAPPRGIGRRMWMFGAISCVAAAALVAAFLSSRPSAIKPQPVKFTFDLPENTTLLRQNLDTAVSPDGHQLAMVAREAAGITALWIRSLEANDAQRIAGTEGATIPFWSPDGQFLGFFAQGKLKKVAVRGGPPQNICSTTAGLGASWSLSGNIVFNPINRAPLMRVSAAGGTPQQVSTLEPLRQENSHRWPSFLPDGRHFLFTARSGRKENTAVYVGSLDSKDIKRLLTEQSNASYVPPGYLLFGRDGTLMAQRFDAAKLEMSGEAFPITGGIDQETPSASTFFSVSSDGNVLAYVEASRPVDQLTWFGRDGSKLSVVGAPGRYIQPRLSPDGKQLAVVTPDPETGNRDIWLMELETGSKTRFTSNPANDWWPAWSPDGAYIAFASDRTPRSSIYRKAANGSGQEELLVTPPESGGAFRPEWSTDGRTLAYSVDKAKGGQELWTLPMFGDRKPRPFLATEFSETALKFSPDGKWVAYTSTESGTVEVYMRPFDDPSKHRVSISGGSQPTWRRDGKELYYMAPGGALMAAEIGLGKPLKVTSTKVLFRPCTSSGADPVFPDYAMTPDGARFLLSCESQGVKKRAITVAVQWKEMVKWPER